MLRKSIALGVLAGFVEYGFTFILQLFLFSLGVLAVEQLTIPEWVPRDLMFTLVALVAIGILRSLVVGSNIYISRMAAQTFFKIKRSRVVSLSLENGHRISTGEAISIFTDEVTRAGQSVMCFSSLVTQSISALILLVLGFRLAPQQMFLGLLMLGVVYIPVRLLSRKSKVTGADISQEWQATSDTLVSGLRNHFFLNIYGLIDNEKKRADNSLSRYLQHFKSFVTVTAIKMSVPNFLGLLIIAILCFYTVKMTSTQGAVLLSFLFIFLRFVQAVGEIVGLLNDFKLYQVSAVKLQEWFARQKISDTRVIQTGPSEKIKDAASLKLELRNLEFFYPDNPQKPIFRDVSLQIGKGDCLVVTGESGTGKSTLLSLLLGVLRPTFGEVLLNGSPIHSVKTDLSSRVGYVGPTPYLIEGTVLENLLYGNVVQDALSPEVITRALKSAEIYDFIQSLPRGLQTPLNEIGNNISTGQRQRISIARAFLRRPQLLIMDEATSNLDMVTESKIIENLKVFLPNFTTIIVSHRKGFLDLATHRLDLNNA